MEKEHNISYYVSQLRDVEQRISALCKEKKAIIDKLILYNCPFKIGDYVKVIDQNINGGIPRYGVIKLIHYSVEQNVFQYVINKINKRTKLCNGERIYYGSSSIIEKYE